MDFFFSYQGQLVLNWAVLSIVVTGYRLTYLAGQFSLAHAALMGLGAYGAAVAAMQFGLGPFGAILVGIAAAGLAALLVGLLSLRLSELTLAVATLAVGMAVFGIIDHTEALGGPIGFAPPMLVEPWMTLVALAVVVMLSIGVDGASFGLPARAVDNDALVAASSGLNVRAVRLTAWALGGVVVGLGGSLFALSVGSITPVDFGFGYLTLILIAVLAGGAGTVIGPLLGAVFVVVLPEFVRIFEIDRGLVYGPLLTLLVILCPNGIIPRWPSAYWNLRERLPRWQSAWFIPVLTDAASESGIQGKLDSEEPLLRVENVSIEFGGIRALDDVSFTVMRGGVHALIGPNGAGKTTLVNIITGALQPGAGRIFFDGQDLTRAQTHQRARAGLARTFQAPRLLPTLTLKQNVAVTRAFRNVANRQAVGVDEIIHDLGLSDVRHRRVGSLNLAEQRKVEIARALAAGPRLVLLDEPTAGMNHVEALELMEAIVGLCEKWGITILLIEHNMHVVMNHSEEIVVVSFGKQIAAGTPDEIRQHPEVINAYLGSEVQ